MLKKIEVILLLGLVAVAGRSYSPLRLRLSRLILIAYLVAFQVILDLVITMEVSTQAHPSSDVKIPHIDSLPNLRIICLRQTSTKNDSTVKEHVAAIYRSSKPDRISVDDLTEFRKMGIKSIVDFRSLGEYRSTDGMCNLDKEYSIYKVEVPKGGYKTGQSVKAKLLVKSDEERILEEKNGEKYVEKKHYFVNFFNASYVITLVRRLPWHMFIYGILHFLYDIIMRNKFKTFVPFFIKYSVNSGGIIGQYIDIVEVCGVSVCTGKQTYDLWLMVLIFYKFIERSHLDLVSI